MAVNVSYSGPLWHVAYVEPRYEREICKDIAKELGFDAYAPVEKRMVTYRGRRVEACRPLFPRYIFVGVDPYKQGWQHLLDVDGVIDVLGRPELLDDRPPSYIPAAWVEAMRRAEAAGVFDRTNVNGSQFKVGERVRVVEGPFTGFEALIQAFIAKVGSTRATKRARLLLAFLGRMSATEIDVTALEKL